MSRSPMLRSTGAGCAAMLACAVLFAACSTPAGTAAGDAASRAPATAGGAAAGPLTVLGLWRIDQARSAPIVDRRRVRLDFGPGGKLTGHTSCNTFSADYTLQGDRLTIGRISTGRAKCGELHLEQEDRILTALERAANARVRPVGLLELREDEFRGVLRGTRFEDGQ